MTVTNTHAVHEDCLCLLLVGPGGKASHRFFHPECPHHTGVDVEGPLEAMEALILGAAEAEWTTDPRALAARLGVEPWASGGEPEPAAEEPDHLAIERAPRGEATLVWQSGEDPDAAGPARVVLAADGEIFFEHSTQYDAMGERIWAQIDRVRDEHKQDAEDAVDALLVAFVQAVLGESEES